MNYTQSIPIIVGPYSGIGYASAKLFADHWHTYVTSADPASIMGADITTHEGDIVAGFINKVQAALGALKPQSGFADFYRGAAEPRFQDK
jgi:hypothetical protein